MAVVLVKLGLVDALWNAVKVREEIRVQLARLVLAHARLLQQIVD